MRRMSRPPGDRPALIDRDKRLAFLLVASLFFAWALAASLNDVLIRHFQRALALSRGEAALIQFAFFVGYFCAALPAGWVMRRLGYKGGILVGLGLYAAGALLFWPAAEVRVFALFLLALYIIAFGLAFLETAANPYIAVLGDPRTGPARLNLAQSFYGLGSILGPAIGGWFILAGVERSPAELAAMGPAAAEAYRIAEARAVQGPYLAVAAFVALLAGMIALVRLPPVANEGTVGDSHGGIAAALRDRRLVAAIVAQFFYVGAQVSIWSYFIDFAREVLPAITDRQAAFLLSGSLATVMVGRLAGAVAMRRFAAEAPLAICAVGNVLLCVAAMTLSGAAALGALWLTSLFMAIMFPTIFALGVRDLGPATKTGSALIIMAIIGGALIPLGFGLMADATGSLRAPLAVPLACFVIVGWFAWFSARTPAPAPRSQS